LVGTSFDLNPEPYTLYKSVSERGRWVSKGLPIKTMPHRAHFQIVEYRCSNVVGKKSLSWILRYFCTHHYLGEDLLLKGNEKLSTSEKKYTREELIQNITV
jgi:hypothetical protein